MLNEIGAYHSASANCIARILHSLQCILHTFILDVSFLQKHHREIELTLIDETFRSFVCALIPLNFVHGQLNLDNRKTICRELRVWQRDGEMANRQTASEIVDKI